MSPKTPVTRLARQGGKPVHKMWAHFPNYTPASCMIHSYKADKYHQRVLVIPWDDASRAALRERIAEELYAVTASKIMHKIICDAIMRKLGFPSPRKTRAAGRKESRHG